MSELPDPGRRRALRMLASTSLLPLGTLSAATLLHRGDPGGDKNLPTWPGRPSATLTSVRFEAMDAPSLAEPETMATTCVRSHLQARFSDGSQQRYALGYHTFFTTGDQVPDGRGGTILAGGYYDIHNKPIIDTSESGSERQFFSDCPDGSSLLSLADARIGSVNGNTVFAVVQFEYTSRNLAGDNIYQYLPAPIAVLTLDQDPSTGQLSLVKYHNVDTSKIHGLWTTCGASLSPWNTHLSSEEYEPDAASIDSNTAFENFGKNLYGKTGVANPYHYGHLPEVTVHSDGTGTVCKHYCMGRISHELVQVMPDKRTVLMGDDATNGGLFLFVADRECNLSSGDLYVAKWHQKSATGPGEALLSWIHLGHATSDEIEAMADVLEITDIMDVLTEDPEDDSYTKIPYSGSYNWIRVWPGMERAAAFLETHRYAALVGGSMGFTKMEGTTVNAADKIAYSAMSYIQSSMLNGSGDIEVEGPKAGAVYALQLTGGKRDQWGKTIRSEWVPAHMSAPDALIGEDLSSADSLGNLANAERIANPDNLKFSEQLRTLFIGEDSGMHVNNFLWAYNVDSGELSRLLSVPAGAESTGLHAVDAINGWTYVMSHFQHPGDWSSPLHDLVQDTLDPLIRANYKDSYAASVGYLTGDNVALRLANG